MSRGFVGQPTYNSAPIATESMTLEHSNAPFGVVLVADSDGFCRIPDKDNILGKGASTGVAVGILLHQKAEDMPCLVPLVPPVGSGDLRYAKEKQVVSLMKEGAVFIKTETDVTRNDPVYYRVTSSDIGNLGGIRNDDDGGKAVKLNGAVYAMSAKAGEIVEITVNLNQIQERY